MPNWDLAKLNFTESQLLDYWISVETRHLDLVASWEQLVYLYSALSFLDEIDDIRRLAEFKAIIHENNKFLTRMRTGLETATDFDAAKFYLQQNFSTSNTANIKDRVSLTYNKLRQQWIRESIAQFDIFINEFYPERKETDER